MQLGPGDWLRPPSRASRGEPKTGTQIRPVCGGDARVEKAKPPATARETMLWVTEGVSQGAGWHMVACAPQSCHL